MALYTNILKQSWKTTWRKKYFWWLGIIALLFSISVEYDLITALFNKNKYFYSLNNFLQGGVLNADLVQRTKVLFVSDTVGFSSFLINILLFILLLFVIIMFATLAQIIIIDHVAKITKGQENNSIRATFNQQGKHAWAVILLILLSKIAVFLGFLIIMLPIYFTLGKAVVLGDIGYIILFIIIIPMIIVFSFIIRYIISYIIIYQQKFRQAIRNGWLLFTENWLVSIEMSIILFLINIFGSVAVVFVIYVLGIPLGFLRDLGTTIISPTLYVIIFGFSFILFLLIFLLGGGILSSYTTGSWTKLFLQLNEEGGESKIVRLTKKIDNLRK